MFKIGDIIVCINNYVKVGFRTFITVGKIYIVAGENDGIITLLNDKGDYDSYNYKRFILLTEYRRLKLEKICSNLEK